MIRLAFDVAWYVLAIALGAYLGELWAQTWRKDRRKR